jgi:hypothetical protein
MSLWQVLFFRLRAMTAITRDDGDFLDTPATIDGIFPKQFQLLA